MTFFVILSKCWRRTRQTAFDFAAELKKKRKTGADVCFLPALVPVKRRRLRRRRSILGEKTTETKGFVENARIFAKKVALFRRALG